mmetsp:Transcript_31643/g.35965  ORF Transcript_31643/g.35965 Transcript_31643/m.35965 type:complete len:189 (+) Transcript_31643:247-813(+)
MADSGDQDSENKLRLSSLDHFREKQSLNNPLMQSITSDKSKLKAIEEILKMFDAVKHDHNVEARYASVIMKIALIFSLIYITSIAVIYYFWPLVLTVKNSSTSWLMFTIVPIILTLIPLISFRYFQGDSTKNDLKLKAVCQELIHEFNSTFSCHALEVSLEIQLVKASTLGSSRPWRRCFSLVFDSKL